MKAVLLTLALFGVPFPVTRPAQPSQTCSGCIESSVPASDGEAGATLEIKIIPPIIVGGTQTGGCKPGQCEIDGEDCVQSRRCRTAMNVKLGGQGPWPFAYQPCHRVKRTSTNPSPWPWVCENVREVNNGTVFEELFLDCGAEGEFRVTATTTIPLDGTVTLEATVYAACTRCVDL